VFEHLGLRVHTIPGDAELVGEEALEETVVAEDLERHATAAVGEPDAAITDAAGEAEPSFWIIAETEPGVTARRSAMALVETAARACWPRCSSS
jgi:hypothetical protein